MTDVKSPDGPSDFKAGTPPPQYPPPVNNQPVPTQGMSTTTPGIGGNRNVKNLPIGPDGQRAWSHGMCSACFGDWGTFCTAWWCPCIVFGRNKERYQYLSEQGIPDPDAGKGYNRDSCEKHGFHTIVTGFGWVYQVALRRKLRERYGIRGSDTSDYCLSFWCNPCALTQESREMELEEDDLRSKNV